MPSRAAGRERHAVEERLEPLRRRPQALELVPLVASSDVHRGAEGLHLRRRHQSGVVVLVTGERQAVALDGVGDKAGRPVVVDPAEGVEHRRQVVAAEVVHQRCKLVIGA